MKKEQKQKRIDMVEKLNKIFRTKNQEELPKNFFKVLRIGKTNLSLSKNSLLFVELVVEDEADNNVKRAVLIFPVAQMKFLIRRLSNEKYGLYEENK